MTFRGFAVSLAGALCDQNAALDVEKGSISVNVFSFPLVI